MRQYLWDSAEIGSAVQAEAGKWAASAINIDTRTLKPGELFVALKGERFDGHDYLKTAFEKGAVAAIVSYIPDVLKAKYPLIKVPDTLKALWQLAEAARACSKAKFIAVTGSVGKTSTKEMLRLALATAGKTYANAGNFNNHIGLPLTLANIPLDTEYAVFEMGMNHPEEIRPLSKLVKPHAAIITTVDAVHLEFFPSVEAIADAKAEIFDGIQKGGAAVLNRDNTHFDRLSDQAKKHRLRVITFGEHAQAQWRLKKYEPTSEGCSILAEAENKTLAYSLQTSGKHWSLLTLGVLALASEVGVDIQKASHALGAFTEPKGRGGKVVLRWSQGNLMLLDDSYNASPASMRAAFEKLKEIKLTTGNRIVAVLGDMLELGATAASLHAGLAQDITRCGIDVVFTAGPLMQSLHDILPAKVRGAHASDSISLTATVMEALQGGDVILIKGSRGSRMDIIANAILKAAETHSESAHAL